MLAGKVGLPCVCCLLPKSANLLSISASLRLSAIFSCLTSSSSTGLADLSACTSSSSSSTSNIGSERLPLALDDVAFVATLCWGSAATRAEARLGILGGSSVTFFLPTALLFPEGGFLDGTDRVTLGGLGLAT